MSYQLNYSLKVLQSITLKDGADDYIGQVPIGLVDSKKQHLLHTTSTSVPVIRGNPAWDSCNWVMEGIAGLYSKSKVIKSTMRYPRNGYQSS
jgi:hypothetical protein